MTRLRVTRISVVSGSDPSTIEVVVTADYWGDMSVQLYGWESLAYLEWWGN